MTQAAKDAAAYIQKNHPHQKPKIGIVLGSGLGALANEISNATVLSYSQIPHFPKTSVQGHGGNLFLGDIDGVPVACLQGRCHFYEGIQAQPTLTLIRTLKLLGCETLLATNAAGSLNPNTPTGSLVSISDHINFQFTNPLVGPNDNDFGDRFVGMEDAYDSKLREKILSIANEMNIPMSEGVYLGVLGPSFETPAEIRAFRLLGADVVGMSTVSEVITARHCGMRVAVISVVTNLAAGLHPTKITHDVTLAGANKASKMLTQLVLEFIRKYEQCALNN